MNIATAFAEAVVNSYVDRFNDPYGEHKKANDTAAINDLSPVQKVAYDGYTDVVRESTEIPSQIDFLEKRCYRLSKKATCADGI